MYLCKQIKKGTCTNCVDLDKTPQKGAVSSGSALFVTLSTFVLMVGNITFGMSRDAFTSLMGSKPLKGVLEQIIPFQSWN